MEKLRPVYDRLIPAYKEGFLAKDVETNKDNRWIWALPHHLYLRDSQLIFAFYCAGCEEKASQQTDDPQARRECLEREAWLLREAAFTAMSIRPDLKRGEFALRRYLEVCDRLEWHERAKAVVHQYRLRMKRLAPNAKLRTDTFSLIQKVTKLPQKVDEEADGI